MITCTEVVDRAIEILSLKGAWTQLQSARDKYGCGVDPFDARACQWCLAGALDRAGFEIAFERNAIWDSTPIYHVFRRWNMLPERWNDTEGRQQSEVVSFLRKLKEALNA